MKVSKDRRREQDAASDAVLHDAVADAVARRGRAERLTIRKALYDRGMPAERIDAVSAPLPDGVAFLTVESVWDYLGGMSRGKGEQ